MKYTKGQQSQAPPSCVGVAHIRLISHGNMVMCGGFFSRYRTTRLALWNRPPAPGGENLEILRRFSPPGTLEA
jgi:hypothetical protein